MPEVRVLLRSQPDDAHREARVPCVAAHIRLRRGARTLRGRAHPAAARCACPARPRTSDCSPRILQPWFQTFESAPLAYPALHKQTQHSASSTAPSKLVICAGQAVHAAKPGLGLKRPAAHIADVPPSAVHPAAHVQVLLSVVIGDAHKDTRPPKAVGSSPSASTASSLQTAQNTLSGPLRRTLACLRSGFISFWPLHARWCFEWQSGGCNQTAARVLFCSFLLHTRTGVHVCTCV